MIRGAWLLAVAAALSVGGCAESAPALQGRTERSLGTVDYHAAFAEARRVLGQYFSVESADEYLGAIRSRPRLAQLGGERLLGSSPAQETAALRLWRQDGTVAVSLRVQVDRLVSSGYGQLSPRADTYSTVPDQTPADVEAATTPQQNQTWRSAGRNQKLERDILDELYRNLHPPGTSMPASATGP